MGAASVSRLGLPRACLRCDGALPEPHDMVWLDSRALLQGVEEDAQEHSAALERRRHR